MSKAYYGFRFFDLFYPKGFESRFELNGEWVQVLQSFYPRGFKSRFKLNGKFKLKKRGTLSTVDFMGGVRFWSKATNGIVCKDE